MKMQNRVPAVPTASDVLARPASLGVKRCRLCVEDVREHVDRLLVSVDPPGQFDEIGRVELTTRCHDVGLQRDHVVPRATSLGECVEQIGVFCH